MNGVIAKRLALNMALMCVRNTCIEDIHAGLEPSSKAGDFSDVKLVTPYGEIPWNKLSRIRNDEMREFMKQVVDRLYTVLLRLDDPEFVERMDHIRVGRQQNGMNPETLPTGSRVDEMWLSGRSYRPWITVWQRAKLPVSAYLGSLAGTQAPLVRMGRARRSAGSQSVDADRAISPVAVDTGKQHTKAA